VPLLPPIILPNEERQDGAHNAHDERAQERRREAGDVKLESERRGSRARNPERERIHDERKQAERDEQERQREEKQDRPDHGVDHAEDERHREKRERCARVGDAGHEANGHPEGGGRDEHSNEK